jgi:GC-rich sequence DNA-binding factor
MSKQRSLRKSKLSFADEEDEEGGDNGSVAIPPAAVKAAQQKKLKERAKGENKSATLLSFDDGGDDEDGPGGVKAISIKEKSKNKPSLRIPPGSTVTLPTASTGYNTQVAAAGEYTAERLKELQSATRRAPHSTTQTKVAAAGMAPPPSATVIEEEDMDIEDEGFGLSIPDQEAIRVAKAKREQLRLGGGGAPDYIDLASGSRGRGTSLEPFAAGMTAPSSKKMQEDTRRSREENEDAVMPAIANEDEDDEEAAWAEEQIKKGIRSAELRNRSAAVTAANKKITGTTTGTAAGFLPPSQSAAVAAAAAEVISSLRAALQRAQLSQRQAEKNLARTDRSLEDCIAGMKLMEEEIEQAGDKYIFIQKLRAYIQDICSMLAEKSPLVEELQDELQRAREDRSRAYSRRCIEIEAEERLPAEAAVTAALSVLSSGGGGGGGATETAAAAATQAAEKEEETLLQGKHIPIELDEFGRDSNVLRRSKVATRISARRDFKSSQHQNKESVDHYPGDITTSESEDEVQTYIRRKGEVLDASETVFRDAADEFSSLIAVKTRLEEWKEKYRGQYNDAYMAESVPALFAPFIRQELLSWNPLDQIPGSISHAAAAANGSSTAHTANTKKNAVSYQGFDQQEWHRLLFDYGMPSDGTAPHPNDPDVNLVPRIVRALVLSLVSATVTRCWRVQSSRQSTIIASMLAELMVYLDPASNEALVGVVKAIESRLSEAVEHLVVPSWPLMALAATPRGEEYMERCFSRGLRLLRSVCAFHQVLPAGILQNLAVQQLAVGKLLPNIRAAVVDPEVLAERAGRLLDALPSAWMQGGLVRGLDGVSEVVQAAVRALEPAAGNEESRNEKKDAAKRLAGVMERLGDGNGAQRLRLLFGVVA